MRKIIILYVMLALVCAGCSQTVPQGPKRPTVTDDSPALPAVETPVEAPDISPAIVPVTVGSVILQLPEDWVCEAVSCGTERFSFGPDDDPGRVVLEKYEGGFGVCGTGLEERELALESGGTALVGYYDGSTVWSFISFGGGWAAHNQGSEGWDVDALELLATVTFEAVAQ